MTGPRIKELPPERPPVDEAPVVTEGDGAGLPPAPVPPVHPVFRKRGQTRPVPAAPIEKDTK